MALLRLLPVERKRGLRPQNLSFEVGSDGSARVMHSIDGQVVSIVEASADEVRRFIRDLTEETRGIVP